MFLRAIGATVAPQKKDPPPLLTLRSTVVFSAAAMAAFSDVIPDHQRERETRPAAIGAVPRQSKVCG